MEEKKEQLDKILDSDVHKENRELKATVRELKDKTNEVTDDYNSLVKDYNSLVDENKVEWQQKFRQFFKFVFKNSIGLKYPNVE